MNILCSFLYNNHHHRPRMQSSLIAEFNQLRSIHFFSWYYSSSRNTKFIVQNTLVGKDSSKPFGKCAGYLKLYANWYPENHFFKYRYVAINSLVLGLRLWLMRWMPPHWILKYLRFQNALLKIIILSKVVACIQICRIESLIEKDGSEISEVPQHQQTKTLSKNNDAYTKFDQIHGAYLFCSLCIKARCLLKKIIFSKPWLNNR